LQTVAAPWEHGGVKDEAAASEIVEFTRQRLFFLAVVMVALNLLMPLLCTLHARLVGREYWHGFWGEGNAITWFSSLQLIAVGVIALLNHQAAALSRRLVSSREAGRSWIWLVFAAGFFFLAVDEQFEVHETVRDRVLRPRGLFDGIPNLRPGDVGLWFYLAVGVICALFLLRELRRSRLALGLFAAALLIIATVNAVDSLPVATEQRISPFWTSAFEEVGELWSELLFLLSFLVLLHRRLGDMRFSAAQPAPDA
jgi:hypothetical protein